MVWPSLDLGPYPRARLSIDLIYTLQRLVHCTHTTEPMASHSHSGGPTAFRQNRSTAMTLSRPLRLTPHWASPGWPRVYQRHQRPPSWQNGPKRGQGTIKTKTSTQGYVCLPGQGMHAHNLPSREAPVRATTKDRIKTFPLGKCGRTELKTRFSGTMMWSTSYSGWT